MMFRPAILAALLLPLPAFAGDVMVSDAWVPTAPPSAPTHAAYISLHNHGSEPRVLVGVSAEGYGMVHLHESKESDGVMTMTMLHQIEIPAGGMMMMKPGGLHVMLMGPKAPLAEGATVPLVLEFANGDKMPIEAMVKPRVPES
ncbi:MAG: copper chaperone PCu(A)C [Pseudomonadota bacterium]